MSSAVGSSLPAYLQRCFSAPDPLLCQCHVRCPLLSALGRADNLHYRLLPRAQEKHAAPGMEPAPPVLLPARCALCSPPLHPCADSRPDDIPPVWMSGLTTLLVRLTWVKLKSSKPGSFCRSSSHSLPRMGPSGAPQSQQGRI